MRRRLRTLDTRLMAVTLSKVGVACVVLGLISWGGKQWLLADWAHQHLIPKTAFLLLIIAAAGAAFYLTALALRVPEVTALTETVKRKLRAKSKAT
jgi:peptidoglycan biosynthesis protein MviN/MurJ (putative lipid II flippase)